MVVFFAFAIEGNPLRGNPMVHFVGGSIKRYPLRGKTNYAVRHLLLKEILYRENQLRR